MTDTMIATVNEGKIRGKYLKNLDGKSFLSFWGVPYAKPPLGKLRFKDPVPPESWSDIRDCTKEGSPCYSYQMVPAPEGMKRTILGSEDCLFLNVFTQKLKQNQNETLKPVMVWIHGGGFTSGSSSSDLYGPEILMTQDIVLVTLNYRLGALGFLSLQNQSIGNAGPKDTVQALKWINKNISVFGGDPNNVTIFGESAGGAMIHYLVLSPLTKGLIHRAIAQSGCAMNTWARGQENNANALAAVLGCTEKDERKILDFLQNLPVSKILAGQEELKDSISAIVVRYFAPTVELNQAGAFISEDPIKLIASGKFNQIPLVMGYNSQEGIFLPILQLLGIQVTYTDFVPHFLGLKPGSKEYEEVNRKIIRFYFGNDIADRSNMTAHYTLATDVYFLHGISKSVRNHARKSSQPVYFYKVSVETKLNVFKFLCNKTEPGVCHGDELCYLFKNSSAPEIVPGSPEDIAVKRFVKLWTNFATCGNPLPNKDQPLLDNVEWKSVKEGELNFLDIGSELKSGTNPDIERIRFWDKIMENVPGF